MDEPGLVKAEVPFPTDYYVVKHANPKELGRIIELALRSQILVTWLQIAGWMIVSKNDGGGTIGNDVSEHVTRMNQALVE